MPCWPAPPLGSQEIRLRDALQSQGLWGAVPSLRELSPRALSSPWAPRSSHRGSVDHHGPDHRLHPDGAGGEVCLQAQRAPTAGGRHRGCV